MPKYLKRKGAINSRSQIRSGLTLLGFYPFIYIDGMFLPFKLLVHDTYLTSCVTVSRTFAQHIAGPRCRERDPINVSNRLLGPYPGLAHRRS